MEDLVKLRKALLSKDDVERELSSILDKQVLGLEVEHLLNKMLDAYYQLGNVDECREVCGWLLDYTWEQLNTGHWKDVSISWRYLYTLSSLFKMIAMSQQPHSNIQEMLTVCDMGLLMGAPIMDNILSKCATILNNSMRETSVKRSSDSENDVGKSKHIKVTRCPSIDVTKAVPNVIEPSLDNFRRNYFQTKTPVIIADAVGYWPAFTTRRWSIDYIKKIAGSRTVPIELGSSYTDDSWSQKLMTISEFIEKYIENKEENVGYLAQHQLFEQIPELNDDIVVPTYCAVGECDDVDINAWFGPCGTISPLHQDPKHNFLVQVMGEKYIRLYAEEHTELLAPHEGPILSNTSQIDVENPDLIRHPHFPDLPYQECILRAGEMLYLPPKCWHYIRSLSVSFSVSFWWH